MHLFLLLKRIKFENGFKLVLHKEKNNYLLNCKNIIEKNTINKIKNLNAKNFYLFCADKYSYAVAKILLKHNFKIKGFLDNNHGMKNHSKFNIKFIPIKYAIKKIKKDKDYVIICNQRKEHIISIANQLINKGISKDKILIKTFTMNLEEKIKNY